MKRVCELVATNLPDPQFPAPPAFFQFFQGISQVSKYALSLLAKGSTARAE
jgi:hypothetical protein